MGSFNVDWKFFEKIILELVGRRKTITERQLSSIWTCVENKYAMPKHFDNRISRAYLPPHLWRYCTLSFLWADNIVLSGSCTWLAHTRRCHSSPYPLHAYHRIFHSGTTFKLRHAHQWLILSTFAKKANTCTDGNPLWMFSLYSW